MKDSEFNNWLGTYLADSKAYCKVCKDTVIAKHCEF